MEAVRSFPKNFYRYLSILDRRYRSLFIFIDLFQYLWITRNSEETLSTQNHGMVRIFSTAVGDRLLDNIAIACWTILPPLSPDKDQSFIIFGFEKVNEIDKYR